jgi:hypothetical protein
MTTDETTELRTCATDGCSAATVSSAAAPIFIPNFAATRRRLATAPVAPSQARMRTTCA